MTRQTGMPDASVKICVLSPRLLDSNRSTTRTIGTKLEQLGVIKTGWRMYDGVLYATLEPKVGIKTEI